MVPGLQRQMRWKTRTMENVFHRLHVFHTLQPPFNDTCVLFFPPFSRTLFLRTSWLLTHPEYVRFSRHAPTFFADEVEEIFLCLRKHIFHGLFSRCRFPSTSFGCLHHKHSPKTLHVLRVRPARKVSCLQVFTTNQNSQATCVVYDAESNDVCNNIRITYIIYRVLCINKR